MFHTNHKMTFNNPQYQEELEVEVLDSARYALIVWNDDVNTFDWVIVSLMEVCKHSSIQAEQCAFLIHETGKYAVKKGSFEELNPMRTALLDRGISVTIS